MKDHIEPRDEVVEEARRNAVRGFSPRPKPFNIGCALFVVALACSAGTFAIALLAAVCAHRWGLS